MTSKPGTATISGMSIAETYLLAMWCPVYGWRESNLGLGTEPENLFGGAKGKGPSGSPVRLKVPIHQIRGGLPRISDEVE
jgi:hypothetical protein